MMLLKRCKDAKIKDTEDKISGITNLAANASLNAKINQVKNEIPNITNLDTTTALTAVENKIPNVSNLVKTLALTQKLVKLKTKLLLFMIMINILQLNIFEKLTSENLLQDSNKQIQQAKVI